VIDLLKRCFTMNKGIDTIPDIIVRPMREKKHERGFGGLSSSFRPRTISQRLVERAAVPMYYLFGNRCRNSFGILMYHRISPHTPGVPAPTWNVTPERFRDQMRGLLAKGFIPWPLRKAIDYHRKGLPIPRNTFVVTFDDGYESVYTNAWPILKELRIPATIFLVTGLLDSDAPLPFEDWPAAGSHLVPTSSWRPISIEQCREISAGGLIDLGTHTHRHEDFRDRPEAFRRDIAMSIKAMQQWFGITEATFAYPYGYADPELAAVAKTAGLICALTAKKELVKPAMDQFAWGRLTAEHYDTAATLAAKMSGWYGTIYDFFHSLRRFNQDTSACSAVNSCRLKNPVRSVTIQQHNHG
jgi:peptidoglycan/xylan/chitin deacetylase (PgdA/CDA1 family)